MWTYGKGSAISAEMDKHGTASVSLRRVALHRVVLLCGLCDAGRLVFGADEALEEDVRPRLGRQGQGLGLRAVEQRQRQPQAEEAVAQQCPREQALQVQPLQNVRQVRGRSA